MENHNGCLSSWKEEVSYKNKPSLSSLTLTTTTHNRGLLLYFTMGHIYLKPEVTAIIIFFLIKVSHEISCRNEQGRDVDWYLSSKLPKLEDEPSNTLLGKGEAYTYLTTSSSLWKLSPTSVKFSSSVLGNTLQGFYDNKDDLTYLLYNDEPPINFTGSSVGHLKGVVVFDGSSGFWLIHSIPKFPPSREYEYPPSGLINGQSILCVTFSTSALNEIAKQLLYNHPNIYEKGITIEVMNLLTDEARSIFTDRPAFVKKAPFTRTTVIKSLGNKPFTCFAKDNQFNNDLYSDLIAPHLQSSLIAETWRRGSGTSSPPSCGIPYTVLDAVSINMTIRSGRNRQRVGFRSTNDHSKWAASVASGGNWVCISDINRMESQKRRGGGALCIQSSTVWQAYSSIINETDSCGDTNLISNLL